jgi:hypothetical protein
MIVFATAFALAAQSAPAPTTVVSGVIPASVQTPAEAVWIDSDGRPAHHCDLADRRWTCTVPNGARGLIVVLGSNRVAFALATSGGATGLRAYEWGSALVVLPGGIADDDLHDIRIRALMPERSAHRPRTTRFLATEQPGVEIVRLSETAFWIAGNEVDRDALLAVEGHAIASAWIPIEALRDAARNEPVAVPVSPPATLSGRVENARGEAAEDVTVDLWLPLASDASTRRETGAREHEPREAFEFAAVRVAETRSGGGGLFAFERLNGGPFVVSVTDPHVGRASATVRTVADPVVLRLLTPPRASGRALRHGVPVAGAVVRFVPDVDAFRNSENPGDLAAETRVSDAAGRFEVVLPPRLSGALAISTPDGAAVRVHVGAAGNDGEIALGDIAVPDPVQLVVRLLDPSPCELSAAGPLGSLGLTMVRGRAMSNVYVFDLPEPGDWALNASCGGRSVVLQPQIVPVPPAAQAPQPPIDVRIVHEPQA